MLDWVLNGVVLLVCFVLVFYFLKRRDENAQKREREKALAAAAKDNEEVIEKPYSLKELREYDGSDENKPILMAVNYKIYDVTKGKDLYGKGGSYEALAGRDASRALATMDLTEKVISDKWDKLSDLGAEEWGVLKDWEQRFIIKYKCVGWLENEPGEDSTEDNGGDQPVVKEVESIGQKEGTVDDSSKDDHPQNGDQVEESQPDESYPIEETGAQVEDSEELSHDQSEGNQHEDQEHDNDQTETDDPLAEDQERNKNEVEPSQGDQEQDENSV